MKIACNSGQIASLHEAFTTDIQISMCWKGDQNIPKFATDH